MEDTFNGNGSSRFATKAMKGKDMVQIRIGKMFPLKLRGLPTPPASYACA